MLKHTLIIIAVALSMNTGCLDTAEDSEDLIGSHDDELFVLSTTIWSSPVIQVCWENSTVANALERAWVRQATLRTWQDVSAVRFIGWELCTTGASGIRIRIADEGPHTKGLGDQLDGRVDGMVLNFTFNNWSPSCKNQRQFCIEAIAAHEFGHALGFAHEQNRPDTPGSCTEPAQGTNGDTMVGGWDLDSIMNYCNPDWNGDGNLSNGDIAGVRLFYGPSSADCDPVPLYSYWNPSLSDHYLSTVLVDGFWGWEFSFEVGLICQDQVAGTVPLHSYWNPTEGVWDHFYTQIYAPNGVWGWNYENVLGYVYQSDNPSLNTRPLCRMWNGSVFDHHYYAPENGLCIPSFWGWNHETIEGYILP